MSEETAFLSESSLFLLCLNEASPCFMSWMYSNYPANRMNPMVLVAKLANICINQDK